MNLLWLNDTKAQTNSPVAPQYVEIVATVIVNGETITFEQPILNDNGSLLLPMRTYYEAIGAQVYWNSETKTASAVRNKKTIDLTINSYTALIDKKSVSLLSPAILYNNQTYVPLSLIHI